MTAVFAANDAMALGRAQGAARARPPVPGEVSVVGFDDVPEAAYFWPGLTTVNQEFSLLGRSAVDLTLRALGGEPDAGRPRCSSPTLVVRASTAAARPTLMLAFTSWRRSRLTVVRRPPGRPGGALPDHRSRARPGASSC